MTMTGDELKSIRLGLHMTQVALAARLGVHSVTLCRWECGHVEIPRAIALAVHQIEGAAND